MDRRLSWCRGRRRTPVAEWIADQIEDAVARGALQSDDRLPPQRELARELRIDVSTVTRAYRDASRRGLVHAHVGRGTFIRSRTARPDLDLALNLPPPLPIAIARDAALLASNAVRSGPGVLSDYANPPRRALEFAARWLRACGMPADPDSVVITGGAQHALLIAASLLPRDVRTVLVEELTYPGWLEVLRLFPRLRAVPIPLDRDGAIPEAIAAIAAKYKGAALYLTPTLQNPTGAVMPSRRREAIARLIEEHQLLLIEDDVYGLVLDRAARPIAASVPERAIYITSLSKTVAPGLRVGYMRLPSRLMQQGKHAVRAMVGFTSPVGVAIATAWIASGTAKQLLNARRRVVRQRHALTRASLGPWLDGAHPLAYHVWLPLQDRDATQFATRAREQGVLVTPGYVFALKGSPASGVRVCIAAAPTDDDLCRGLAVLSSLMQSDVRAPRSHGASRRG